MQFIDYPGDGTVRLYHTHPHLAGTPGFECGGYVPLTDLVPVVDPVTGESDGSLGALCPGCGAFAVVPLMGGTDAQRLHAHKRLADPKHPAQTLPDAIESVLAYVYKANGLPSAELAHEGLACCEGVPDAKTQPLLYALHVQVESVT